MVRFIGNIFSCIKYPIPGKFKNKKKMAKGDSFLSHQGLIRKMERIRSWTCCRPSLSVQSSLNLKYGSIVVDSKILKKLNFESFVEALHPTEAGLIISLLD